MSVTHSEVVVPSDTVNFQFVCNAIYVGTGGDVATVNANGTTVTVYANVPSGTYIWGSFRRVNATDTDASDMVATRGLQQGPPGAAGGLVSADDLAALGVYAPVTLELNSVEIDALDAGVILVPTPGANKVRFQGKIAMVMVGNGGGFPSAGVCAQPRYGVDGMPLSQVGEYLKLNVTDDSFQTIAFESNDSDGPYWDLDDIKDKPIVIQAGDAPMVPGAIVTSTPSDQGGGAGGSGWAVNDTFDLPANYGSGVVHGVVDTVSSGAVLTWHATNSVAGFLSGDIAAAQNPSGTGVDLFFSVDSIDVSANTLKMYLYARFEQMSFA